MASAAKVGYEVVTGSFTGTAGSIDITGSLGGWTPTAVMLFLTPKLTDDTMTDGVATCIAIFDGTTEEYIFTHSEDAFGSAGNHAGLWDNGSANGWYLEDHAENLLARGSFDKFITNGVRLTGVAGTSDVSYTAIFFYGSDVQAKALAQDLGNGAQSFDITSCGFQPTIVFLVKGSGSTANVKETNAHSIAFGASTGSDTSGVFQGHRGTQCYGHIPAAGSGIPGGGNSYNATGLITIGSFDSAGFTITVDFAAANTVAICLALKLGTCQASVAARACLTGTPDDDVVVLGWEPGLLVQGSTLSQLNVANTSFYSAMWGIAAYDGATQEVLVNVHEDGVATMNTSQIRVASNILNVWSENHLSEFAQAAASFQSTGYTMGFSIVNGALAFDYVSIAMEEGTPGTPPAVGTSWTEETAPAASWSEQTAPGASWSEQTPPATSWTEE